MRVTGYERLYRKFWNAKAEEICKNKTLAQWTKSAIEGIIVTEWTLKKTVLMHTHATELLSKGYPLKGKKRQKDKTVINNSTEMLHVHINLLSLDEKLRKLKDSSNTERNKKRKIEEIEVKMKATLSSLKTLQESLRKSMENMAKENNVQNVEISNGIEVDTQQLSKKEIQKIILAIKEEVKNSTSDRAEHKLPYSSDFSVEESSDDVDSLAEDLSERL